MRMKSEKLTIKQETFCQEYLTNGGNASDAYRTAYDAHSVKPEVIWVRASELLKNSKVAVRIKELQAETNKKYEVTREYLNDILFEILTDARKILVTPDSEITKKDLELMRKTTMDFAKLNGLIVDKAELQHTGTVVVMDAIKKNGKEMDFDIGDN